MQLSQLFVIRQGLLHDIAVIHASTDSASSTVWRVTISSASALMVLRPNQQMHLRTAAMTAS